LQDKPPAKEKSSRGKYVEPPIKPHPPLLQKLCTSKKGVVGEGLLLSTGLPGGRVHRWGIFRGQGKGVQGGGGNAEGGARGADVKEFTQWGELKMKRRTTKTERARA